MPNRWTTQFETWTDLKSQINPPTCLDSNAKPLDHSIWDLGSPQAKSSPNVFGFKCQTVEPPSLRLEQIWSLKLSSSTCLDPGFQTVELPNSRLEQISNPKFSLRFSKFLPPPKARIWRHTSERRTNFRSARSELEGKESRSRKSRVLRENQESEAYLDFWPMCQPVESQRAWQKVTRKLRKIFRSTWGQARKSR